MSPAAVHVLCLEWAHWNLVPLGTDYLSAASWGCSWLGLPCLSWSWHSSTLTAFHSDSLCFWLRPSWASWRGDSYGTEGSGPLCAPAVLALISCMFWESHLTCCTLSYPSPVYTPSLWRTEVDQEILPILIIEKVASPRWKIKFSGWKVKLSLLVILSSYYPLLP